MDMTPLLGSAQDAYVAGLQKQVAAKAATTHAVASKAGMDNARGEKKVRETAEQFEAFFIGQMMEHMMAGIEPNETFGGGSGEEMWRSMLNQEYGKEVAKSGRLGIADHVMKGMLQAQEARDAAAVAAARPAKPAVADGDLVQQTAAPAAFIPLRR